VRVLGGGFTLAELRALEHARLAGYLVTRLSARARLVRGWQALCEAADHPFVWIWRHGDQAEVRHGLLEGPPTWSLDTIQLIERVAGLLDVSIHVRNEGLIATVPLADAEPLARIVSGLGLWHAPTPLWPTTWSPLGL
jgi:hypothetical protein